MGNLFSRKKSFDVETLEGWDAKMQEIISKIDNLHLSKNAMQRRIHVLKNVLLLLAMIMIVAIFGVNYLFHEYLIETMLCCGICVIVCVFIYIYMRFLQQRYLAIDDRVLMSIKEKTNHIQLLNKVKARIPDITSMMIKYNIDSRVFNNEEVEHKNKVIQELLDVIKELVSMPLCKDCRYFTEEERGRIMNKIPAVYQSLFTNIKPRCAEEEKKPFDERIMMQLEDSERDGENRPILLLDDTHINRIADTANPSDSIQIEEVEEEIKEEIMEDESGDESVRKRNVASADCVVCFNTYSKNHYLRH